MQKLGGVLVNRKIGWKEALIKFLLYGGEFWFLYVLFEICLLTPIIHFMCLKIKRALLFEIVLFGASLLIKGNTFCVNLVIYYMFYYTLGQILHLYSSEKAKKIFSNKLTVIAAALLFTVLLLTKALGIDFLALNIMAALSGSLVLYWIAKHMKPQNIATRYFERAGIYSMGFYIVQGYCLVITRTVLISLLKMSNPYIIYISLVIGICTEAMIACMIMSKIKPIAYLMGIPYNTKTT